MSESAWLKSRDPEELLALIQSLASPRKLRLFALSQARRIGLPDDPGCRPLCERLLDVAFREAEGLTSQLTEEQLDDGETPELEELFEKAEFELDIAWSGFLEVHDLSWTSATNLKEWASRDVAYYCAEPNPFDAALQSIECMIELALRQAARERLGAEVLPLEEDESNHDRGERIKEACRAEHEEPVRAELGLWVREIFGNPFRPVSVDPAWLSWNDGTVLSIAQQIYESESFGSMPVLADALQEAGCQNPSILDHCRVPTPHCRGCWVLDLLLSK